MIFFFYSYSEEDFFRLSRMRKTTFDILLTLLLQTPDFKTVWYMGRKPMEPCKKALVALLYLSSTQTIRQIEDKFNVADSSVYKCRNDFLEAIRLLRNRLIKWPHSEEDQLLVTQQFESLANFKGRYHTLYYLIARLEV